MEKQFILYDELNSNINSKEIKYDAITLATKINHITDKKILENILLIIYHYYNINKDDNVHFFKKYYNKYSLVYKGKSETLNGPTFILQNLPYNLQLLLHVYVNLLFT